MRILPADRPAPLLARPKLLVGFSDVTALHAVLNRAGLATVHGPVVTQLGARAGGRGRPPRGAALGRRPARRARGRCPRPGAGLVAARDDPARPRRRARSSAARSPSSPTCRARRSRRGSTARSSSSRTWARSRTASTATSRSSGSPARSTGSPASPSGSSPAATTPGVLAADVVREAALALGVPAVEGVPAGHEDANFALPLGARATLVAPAPDEEGPPRLLFDGWARGAPRDARAPVLAAAAAALEAGRREGVAPALSAAVLRGGARRPRELPRGAAGAGAAAPAPRTTSSTSPRSRR